MASPFKLRLAQSGYDTLRGFLFGRWTLRREIVQLKDGSLIGRMRQGTAEFGAAAKADVEGAASHPSVPPQLLPKGDVGCAGVGRNGGVGGGGGEGGEGVGSVDGLLYREEGELAMGSKGATTMSVWRQYLYTFDGGGDSCRVHFYTPQSGDDEHLKFFHALAVDGGGRCDSLHHCGDDIYTGRFDMVSPDAFRTAWDVRGPSKDYSIRSTYERGVDGGGGGEGAGGGRGDEVDAKRNGQSGGGGGAREGAAEAAAEVVSEVVSEAAATAGRREGKDGGEGRRIGSDGSPPPPVIDGEGAARAASM
jgi:hypothetical protein